MFVCVCTVRIMCVLHQKCRGGAAVGRRSCQQLQTPTPPGLQNATRHIPELLTTVNEPSRILPSGCLTQTDEGGILGVFFCNMSNLPHGGRNSSMSRWTHNHPPDNHPGRVHSLRSITTGLARVRRRARLQDSHYQPLMNCFNPDQFWKINNQSAV